MHYHHTDHAPAIAGSGSQAISADGWLYTSAQIALDPTTGELVSAGFEVQARQVLSNLGCVLSSAGCTFADVVKATFYLTDFADLDTLNRLFGEAIGSRRPALSTVLAAALPNGALLAIDLVVRLPK